MLLTTNGVSQKIFLITCTILIKTLNGNVTKFKKFLTWPRTNTLLFHCSLCILRKPISRSFYNRALPKSNLKSGSAPVVESTKKFIYMTLLWLPVNLCTIFRTDIKRRPDRENACKKLFSEETIFLFHIKHKLLQVKNC